MPEAHAQESWEVAAGEVLTWDEIHARYPDQYLVLVDTDWSPDDFRFRSARVAGRGPTRKAAIAQCRDLLARHAGFAYFYTGQARLPPRNLLAPLRP